MKQEYTSADTSVRQISAVYSKFNFNPYSTILDIGCGKYFQDTITEMAKRGCIACGYDPYNQVEVLNEMSLSMFKNKKPNYIVCSNVLNVIKEDECIDDVVKMIDEYAEDNTKIIFSVYQRDRSGNGKLTTKGWQRNQITKLYVPSIEKHLRVVKVKGNFIECAKKEVA